MDDGTPSSGWLPKRRTVFAVAAAIWMSFALLQLIQSFVFARATGRTWVMTDAIVSGLPWWLSWLVLTPLIGYLAERFPLTDGRHWQSLGRHAVAGVIVATVQVIGAGTLYWFTTGRYAGVAASLGNQIQRYAGNVFLESIVTYAATAGVFIAIDFARAMRDSAVLRARLETRAAELESSAARARLDALLMQMNPHFLFNTLAAVSGLVSQERRSEAREVIERLGGLLCQSLGNGHDPFSTVGREAELLEDYLYIQRIRFSDRLTARVDIDADARPLLMPAMLLQPLVENAIRHGVEPREGSVAVDVSVRREGDALWIRVADSGWGLALDHDGRPLREGIGLANTRERLEHLYGSAATLQLRNRVQGGAEAVVRLPVRSEAAMPDVALV